MKKIFFIFLALFMTIHLFAYDLFSVMGFQNEFHTEYYLIEDNSVSNISHVIDASADISSSSGVYLSGNLFNDDDNFLGIGFSNVLSLSWMSKMFYIGDRILIGPSIRLTRESIPIALTSGLIFQPEYELIFENSSSSHVLLGMGFDFQLGTNMEGLGFGTALSIGLYPIAFINIYNNHKTTKLNIEKYGRLSIGLSFGSSYTK